MLALLEHMPSDPDDLDSRGWVDHAPLDLATGRVDFPRSRFVRADGGVEVLTTREAELLAYLADHADEPVSRDDLLVHVWGHHELSMSRAVDATIRRLRRKLEPDAGEPQVLFTVHGHGYRLFTGAGPAPEPAPAQVARRILRLGDRSADLAAGWVDSSEGRVQLTAKERLVLEQLVRARGAAVEAGALARKAGVIGGKRALTNTVYRLRAKLEDDPGTPRFLVSVPGSGYRLDAEVAEPEVSREQLVRALRSLTDHVGLVMGLRDCVVYARDGNALTQVAAFGPKRADDGGVRSPLTQRIGEGIVGVAAAEARPWCVHDVSAEPRYVRDLALARSELAVPVRFGGRVVGVLDSESGDLGAYSDATTKVFLSLAAIAAPAFQRSVGANHE